MTPDRRFNRETDRAARPMVWPRARPRVPCPRCDRMLTDQGTKAVVCDRGMHRGKAYLTCRCCGHEFALGIA